MNAFPLRFEAIRCCSCRRTHLHFLTSHLSFERFLERIYYKWRRISVRKFPLNESVDSKSLLFIVASNSGNENRAAAEINNWGEHCGMTFSRNSSKNWWINSNLCSVIFVCKDHASAFHRYIWTYLILHKNLRVSSWNAYFLQLSE